ncbi:uncharacterized protein LOC141611609 [Silene latifolia]|uniref:uncharacterized protein LOC141611609 n=1 Tax=Silene latifolia TaxID=37657 RepID=UPI003D788D13
MCNTCITELTNNQQSRMGTKSLVEKVEKNFWGMERYELKLKDRALEKERKRERETNPQNSTAAEIIQHFSHSHPLTYIQPGYQRFECNTCERRGEGKRYHCAQCEFDLHLACASMDITWLVHHMPSEEMAAYGVDQETIVNSFAHPAHDLITVYKKESFKCGHCNDSGDGLRLCCHVCDVQFHRVCVNNPTKITSYLFPEYELHLKLSRPLFTKCGLCGDMEPTNSLMYGFKESKFYLHPGCTQWPLYLAHPLHPPHPLVLKLCGVDAKSCSACGDLIGMYNSYKYNCKPCGLDFHLSCILRHSKLGIGQEVKRDYYPGQCITLLPVTNLILPDTDWKKPHPSGLRWGITKYTLDSSDQIIDAFTSS